MQGKTYWSALFFPNSSVSLYVCAPELTKCHPLLIIFRHRAEQGSSSDHIPVTEQVKLTGVPTFDSYARIWLTKATTGHYTGACPISSIFCSTCSERSAWSISKPLVPTLHPRGPPTKTNLPVILCRLCSTCVDPLGLPKRSLPAELLILGPITPTMMYAAQLSRNRSMSVLRWYCIAILSLMAHPQLLSPHCGLSSLTLLEP
ncbi:hypothetical protein CRM22_007918 [Opisthorchis felineus]|uniref:Uncharacterized protein n=1 Tax=Opisthorchis felineus TaxID=147828 RepID=A0A4S2LFT1_OPIFE|nr:hypothetical protein CRM22_007918 [Opisthorchis felineus]